MRLVLVEFADILLATCMQCTDSRNHISVFCQSCHTHSTGRDECCGHAAVDIHTRPAHYMQVECSKQMHDATQNRLKKACQASMDKSETGIAMWRRCCVWLQIRLEDTPAGAYVANSSASSRTSSKFPANSDTNSRRKYLGGGGHAEHGDVQCDAVIMSGVTEKQGRWEVRLGQVASLSLPVSFALSGQHTQTHTVRTSSINENDIRMYTGCDGVHGTVLSNVTPSTQHANVNIRDRERLKYVTKGADDQQARPVNRRHIRRCGGGEGGEGD